MHFHREGDTGDVIAPAVTLSAFRIVQEALANVEKHARASSVAVGSTTTENGELRAWVNDDGIGFTSDAMASAGDGVGSNGSSGAGFGLLSLRERARLAGGTLEVESAPGAGTRVTVSIPVEIPALMRNA